MKPTVLHLMLFLLIGTVAQAQLSFLPQMGFERSRTTVDYHSLSTASVNGNFKASLKADYRFKGGHGPFVNLGTNAAPVTFSFNNAGALLDNAGAVNNNLQFRIETGYQYTSNPIKLFGKKTPANANTSTEVVQQTVVQKSSCGSYAYKSSCGSKKKIRGNAPVDNTVNMRLQPALGFAYIPSTTEAVNATADGFQYTSGWKTAVVPSMGFEFAKGKQRFLTLTVFYTKPLDLQEQTYTDFSGAKALTTTLNPAVSTWAVTAGVPFSFTKTNADKTKKVKKDCKRIMYKRCYRS